VDVTGLEQGSSDAVVGRFTSDGSGAIETAVSPDGHYVFVTLEDSDQLAVFNLERALSHGFGPYDLVGMIPLGEAPVGIAIAPDHRYMYATSEDEQGSRLGTLTTISLARAVTYPARAIVSTVVAGCSPVRVVTSPSTVYVTARGSDALVEFSAGALVSDPSHALVSSLRVGEAPVGVALVQEGKEIVVADSNRFGANGTAANIAVVRVTTGDRLSLVGYVPSGAFPRDMAVTLNGRRVLVSNYDSSQVETVEVPGTR
jgi:DNA-binding beta-propeller fold protein YncE